MNLRNVLWLLVYKTHERKGIANRLFNVTYFDFYKQHMNLIEKKIMDKKLHRKVEKWSKWKGKTRGQKEHPTPSLWQSK
jgi:hypothetical protein